MRRLLSLFLLLAALGLLVGAGWPRNTGAAPQRNACSTGYVDAVIGGAHKCLHAGEFCSPSHEAEYETYGFACVDGHLRTGGSSTTTTTVAASGAVSIGRTVLLAPRTRTSGCRLGVLPDRRCSPGAYYSGLTKAVICSPTFRTSTIRNVPTSEKHEVEAEYGLAPKPYGRTLEIDHIVSLELGGSNDIANLFPEKSSFPGHEPGFRVKDKLENVAHDAVCEGKIALRTAQRQIAANWLVLYKRLFGVAAPG